VVAKLLDRVYEPDRRVWRKVKHTRTADCVVAGYRLHKRGEELIGSLLPGLYTDTGSWPASAWWGRSRWPGAGSCLLNCSRW
jgi:ATP-dependent DNA ligase